MTCGISASAKHRCGRPHPCRWSPSAPGVRVGQAQHEAARCVLAPPAGQPDLVTQQMRTISSDPIGAAADRLNSAGAHRHRSHAPLVTVMSPSERSGVRSRGTIAITANSPDARLPASHAHPRHSSPRLPRAGRVRDHDSTQHPDMTRLFINPRSLSTKSAQVGNSSERADGEDHQQLPSMLSVVGAEHHEDERAQPRLSERGRSEPPSKRRTASAGCRACDSSNEPSANRASPTAYATPTAVSRSKTSKRNTPSPRFPESAMQSAATP